MKSENLFLTSLLGAVLATTLLTAGCASSSKVTNTESVGKQLLDLDSAYQKGVITQDQYNKLKKEIIRKND